MDVYTLHIQYDAPLFDTNDKISILNKVDLFVNENGNIKYIMYERFIDTDYSPVRNEFNTLPKYIAYYYDHYKDIFSLEKIRRNVRII